ncbi:MAG: hypothetical protein CM1200mP33_6630 [Chloroflexota bacterium]|nr:MAG: hypothetical protein CM1200mP33_6630 [Chloroflexota bacterium]
MVRLETTIDDFNKEVDDFMDSLKKSSDEKEKLMQKIKSGESKKSPKKIRQLQVLMMSVMKMGKPQ